MKQCKQLKRTKLRTARTKQEEEDVEREVIRKISRLSPSLLSPSELPRYLHPAPSPISYPACCSLCGYTTQKSTTRRTPLATAQDKGRGEEEKRRRGEGEGIDTRERRQHPSGRAPPARLLSPPNPTQKGRNCWLRSVTNRRPPQAATFFLFALSDPRDTKTMWLMPRGFVPSASLQSKRPPAGLTKSPPLRGVLPQSWRGLYTAYIANTKHILLYSLWM